MLDRVIIVTRIAFLAWAIAFVSGCPTMATDKQLGVMRDSVVVLKEEMQKNKQDLAVVEDPVERAKLEAAIDTQLRQIKLLEGALLKAETMADVKWTTAEAILGVVGGFFPPALLGLPWIRMLRRQRTAIFESVRAGGGPANPDAARMNLMNNSPGARKAFKNWKKANGLPAPTVS